jgi:hypothetical protein
MSTFSANLAGTSISAPGGTRAAIARKIARYEPCGDSWTLAVAAIVPPQMSAARGLFPNDRRASAHVSDAPLGRFLGWRFWLCRKLKHRCLLALAQVRQENTGAIRKFECVVMHSRHIFIDFSERAPS